MSLRLKIYLIVGFTLLVAVAALFMVSQTVFMRGFVSVEKAEMQEQIKRAKAALSWDLTEVTAAARSYASNGDIVTVLRIRGDDGHRRKPPGLLLHRVRRRRSRRPRHPRDASGGAELVDPDVPG